MTSITPSLGPARSARARFLGTTAPIALAAAKPQMQRGREMALTGPQGWMRLPRLARFAPLPRPAGIPGTTPSPLVDLSKFEFRTLTRPDGRKLQMEAWGEIVIPDVLSPGGVEMEPLVINGPQARLQCFGDTGKGTRDQFEVAANIVALSNERHVHATMHLGDIIYPAGITKADDPRIDAWVVKPYGTLPNMHAVMGNHEYGSTSTAGIAEAWLEAAKAAKPGMFAMPARYYSRRILVDGMTVRCLFIDSSTLAVDPPQVAWLKGELEKGADRTIVFGHHTIYSGGMHGALPHLEKVLLPLLEASADLYICGHDHNLQFLRSDKGFPLVVSGAGGENRLAWKSGGHSEYFNSAMGTSFLSIDKSGITIDIVDGHTKKTLFTKHLAPRPTQPAKPQ